MNNFTDANAFVSEKKIVILLLLLLLLLCSCTGKDKFVEDKSINKLTKKFSYTNGVCLRDNAMIKFSSFNRGDNVTIIDEDDDYYFVKKGSLTLKIKKDFIRTELDEPFVGYHAYTRGGSYLYSDVNGSDAIDTFSLNDEIEVIDEFGGMLYIEANGIRGYMYPSQISKTFIPVYIAPKPQYEESYDTGGSAGGGGGGESSPSPAPSPTPIPQQSGDGEDISIYIIPKYKTYCMAYSNELAGTILMDNTESYLSTVNRNENVYILSETEEEYIVLINGYQGKINKKYVRKENEEAYKKFEGYTLSGASLYSDYEMNNIILIFGINETVTIIDEVDDVYVIELDDGSIGYMKKSNISKDRIYIAPRVETPVEEPIYDTPSDGGGGGGESSPSPSPAPAQEEWTPAIM